MGSGDGGPRQPREGGQGKRERAGGPHKREGKPLPEGGHARPAPQDRPDRRPTSQTHLRREQTLDELRYAPGDPPLPLPVPPPGLPTAGQHRPLGKLKLRPWFWILLVLSGVAVLVGVKLWSWLAHQPAWEGRHTVAKVLVKPGMTLRQVADELHRLELLDDPRRLLLASRLLGGDRGVQVSAFILDSGMSPVAMLRQLLVFSGPTIKARIPEGARTAEAIGILARATGRDSLLMAQMARDSSFMRLLGLQVPDLDGLLFPDTYFFSPVEDERAVLFKAVMRFQQELGKLLPEGAADSLDLRRLTTLASIVQAEYQVAGEADTIAAVYLNRLDVGMKLQADPTVQYLLPRSRRLYLKDLNIDSPYNTYRYEGLPPGPIGCPGKVALEAVLKPARCDYLFFVSLGDGRHAFSRTYGEHLVARRTLDALRARLDAGELADSLSQLEQAAKHDSGRTSVP
jgi:UPF0755 protein